MRVRVFSCEDGRTTFRNWFSSSTTCGSRNRIQVLSLWQVPLPTELSHLPVNHFEALILPHLPGRTSLYGPRALAWVSLFSDMVITLHLPAPAWNEPYLWGTWLSSAGGGKRHLEALPRVTHHWTLWGCGLELSWALGFHCLSVLCWTTVPQPSSSPLCFNLPAQPLSHPLWCPGSKGRHRHLESPHHRVQTRVHSRGSGLGILLDVLARRVVCPRYHGQLGLFICLHFF